MAAQPAAPDMPLRRTIQRRKPAFFFFFFGLLAPLGAGAALWAEAAGRLLTGRFAIGRVRLLGGDEVPLVVGARGAALVAVWGDVVACGSARGWCWIVRSVPVVAAGVMGRVATGLLVTGGTCGGGGRGWSILPAAVGAVGIRVGVGVAEALSPGSQLRNHAGWVADGQNTPTATALHLGAGHGVRLAEAIWMATVGTGDLEGHAEVPGNGVPYRGGACASMCTGWRPVSPSSGHSRALTPSGREPYC